MIEHLEAAFALLGAVAALGPFALTMGARAAKARMAETSRAS